MAGSSSSSQSAIGIDLGTTYSCVAVWRNNGIEIIQNEQGNMTTPSIVAFTETNRLIGEDAKNQATSNYKNTVFDVKRLIGRRFGDASVQSDLKLWPFEVVSGERDKPMIVVQYKGERKEFLPEQISSFVLTKMADIAKARLGYSIKDVVVTVPAYFNELQRQATKDAGKIANLNVMAILNEPTAAAMAYGFDKKPDGKILIFDLGGGTFDVTIAEVKKGNINVKATTGDSHLGGVDFNNNMVRYLIEKFNKLHNVDISKNPRARKKLLYQCERAKRTLSLDSETYIEIESIHKEIDFSYTIYRTEFEELNRHLFKKCIGKVEKCLRDIKMDKSEIQYVVLVGGSTKIPKVQSMLKKFFNEKVLCKGINPDEAVAYGAALQAACLSNKVPGMVLHDVTPLSLGIWTKGDIFHTVVPRNTAIPTKMEKVFVTTEDNQSSFLIQVYQGERTEVKYNVLLRKCVLEGIPLARRGVSEMTVCFEINTNGILTVSAEDKVNGKRIEVTIDKDQRRLDEEEISRMVSDAKRYKAEDEKHKKNVEAKNELAGMLIDLKNSFRKDKREIQSQIERIQQWLKEDTKLVNGDQFRGDYGKHLSALKKIVDHSSKRKLNDLKNSILKDVNIKPEDMTNIQSQIGRIEQWLNKEVKLVNGDQFGRDYDKHLSALKEIVDDSSNRRLEDLKNSIRKDGNIDKANIQSQIGRIEQWLSKDVKLVNVVQFRRECDEYLSDLKKIVNRSSKSSFWDHIGKALSIALNVLQIVVAVGTVVAMFL